MSQKGKDLVASKTFWANAIALIVSIASGFGLDLGLDADQQLLIVGGIMAVVNMYLRLVTKEPINAIKS